MEGKETENKTINLKNNLFVYLFIWIVFVMTISLCLKSANVITVPVFLTYFIYYIVLLNYESKKLIVYMKTKHNDVWKSINVSFGTNIFKWYKILGENSQNKDIKIVKKHLNSIVFLHALQIMTFFIVPWLQGMLK